MFKYPMLFQAESSTQSGVQKTWTITSKTSQDNWTATCAVPPEFNGPGGGFSPEDLFAQALTNCFVATFKVYAENSKLDYEGLNASSTLTVDLDENKKPVMKKLKLSVSILNPSNQEKAELLAKKSFQSGFILNSVKTEIEFEYIKNEI